MCFYSLFSIIHLVHSRYYDIDSSQVNGTIREIFINFSMLVHKSLFPTSSASEAMVLLWSWGKEEDLMSHRIAPNQ